MTDFQNIVITKETIKRLVKDIKEIKNNLSIKVFHPETGWPLPYYFRGIENSGYYPNVVGNISSDVIISDAAYDPSTEINYINNSNHTVCALLNNNTKFTCPDT